MALQVSEKEAQVNDAEARIRRIREERASYARKANAAIKELDSLQDRYKQAMEKAGTKGENRTKHEKEMLGLGKEILWLRARLRREQKFRCDLAWSKGLMELGERVRVAWYVVRPQLFSKASLLTEFLCVAMKPTSA